MENKFIPVNLFAKYIKFSDADNDDLLALYLNAAQEVIESYIGYKLELQEYQDSIIPASAGHTLSLRAAHILELVINDKPAEIIRQNVNIIETKTYTNKGAVLNVTYKAGFTANTIPSIIKLTMLRIASLMASEEGGDIAVTSKSFGNDGSRTFISTRNYAPFLKEVDAYRIL